jgi:endonuclease/exonuclease/phosphatase family metal-dependent hydrolase
VCQAVDLVLDGRALTVANLHATNNSDIARVEVGLAADFVAGTERCILCGDFNVPAYAIKDFSEPIEGIDQILVRGLELESPPRAWPLARRRVKGALLSDHAPVEAEVAWT